MTKNAVVTNLDLGVSGIMFKKIQKCLEEWIHKNKLKGIAVIWIEGGLQFVITDDCNLGNPIDSLKHLVEGILLGWDSAEYYNTHQEEY